MAIKLGTKEYSHAPSAKCDLVAEATDIFFSAEEVFKGKQHIEELDTVLTNLITVSKAVQTTQDVHGSLEALGCLGECCDLLGVAEDKLTYKVAVEGLGQKIADGVKAVLKAIRDFIMRLVDRIKAFFGKAAAKELKASNETATTNAEEALKNGAATKPVVRILKYQDLHNACMAYINDAKDSFKRRCLMIPESIWGDDPAEAQKLFDKFCENPDYKAVYGNMTKIAGFDITGVDGKASGVKGTIGVTTDSEYWKGDENKTPADQGWTDKTVMTIRQDCNNIFKIAGGEDNGKCDMVTHLDALIATANSKIKATEGKTDDPKAADQVKVLKIHVYAAQWACTRAIAFAKCGWDLVRIVNSTLAKIKK